MLSELINIGCFYYSFEKVFIGGLAILCQAVLIDIIYLFACALFIFLSRIEAPGSSDFISIPNFMPST